MAYRRGLARRLRGIPIILLTTTGRKSGRAITSPLVSVRDGDAFIIIASAGGANQHPSWWLNLVANPEAVVQADDATIKVRMEEVTDPVDKDRLWMRMAGVFPGYNGYQRKTARIIPLALLRPRP